MCFYIIEKKKKKKNDIVDFFSFRFEIKILKKFIFF